MPSTKEISGKIKSVQNTRKITKAMEMVARRDAQGTGAACVRSVQWDKIRNIVGPSALANPEYRHPFVVKHEGKKAAGVILITTDKGLCGGLIRHSTRGAAKVKELSGKDVRCRDCDRQQSLGFCKG